MADIDRNDSNALPTGTVTFMFTDIEGSTKLLRRLGDGYPRVLEQHHRIIREVFRANNGVEINNEGDAFVVGFGRATDAAAAAVQAQRDILSAEWPLDGRVKVRMGLHTGEISYSPEGGYMGMPLHEGARISSAAHGGQILVSQVARELIADNLPAGASLKDLGEHRLRDFTHPQHIYQVCAPDLPGEFPPIRSLDTPLTNLPVPATPLVGREWEVESVINLLKRDSVRLVTLTGAGGMGKSRIALEVGKRLLEDFDQGVWLVPLAPVLDPSLVVTAITTTLNVPETEADSPLQSLKEALGGRSILLVMDNFEQVLEAAPLLAELLAATTRVKFLVTSRAVLNLRGEYEFSVPPMGLPPEGTPVAPADLDFYSGIKLFVERAEAADANFRLTEENAAAIVEICTRLDGLPLAIELAAARIRILPPREMLGRLDRSLSFLTGGTRDLPDRQRTLRSAIDWSYQLLDESEKKLFARLAVFVRNRTLEAAEEVCNLDGELDVLEGLSSLVEKSLIVQQEVAGEARFYMLETIREFALGRLAEAGELDAVRGRHASYYLSLATMAERELRGPQQLAWLERLEQEHFNMRAALGWADDRDADLLLRLAGALWDFWRVRGYLEEARFWLEKSLEKTEGVVSEARGKVLRGSARLAVMSGKGGLEVAQDRYEAALAIYKELANDREFALTLKELGNMELERGNYEGGRAKYEESLPLHRAAHNELGLAETLNNIGVVCRIQGDWEVGIETLTEAIDIATRLGDQQTRARASLNVGMCYLGAGDLRSAAMNCRTGLVLWDELGGKWDLTDCLDDLGAIASVAHDHVSSARLLGAARGLRDSLGAEAAAFERVLMQPYEDATREALGDAAYSKEFEKGRQMLLRDAVQLALDVGADAAEGASASVERTL